LYSSDASSRRFRTGWILVFIALFASIPSFLLRWSYENQLRGAQLTVDFDDTRTLADAYQIPHKQFLAELKKRGVTNIAVYHLSLAGMRDNGRVALTPLEEARRLHPDAKWDGVSPSYRTLVSATPENQALIPVIFSRLSEQGQKSLPPRLIKLETGDGILIPASRQLVSDAAIGFDPAQVAFVKAADMTVTARVSNSINLNIQRVQNMLYDVKTIGAKIVIFSEDEVVGYDSLIKDVAKEMKARDLVFGNIEFTKQRGWQDFAKQTEGRLVRVHSVGGDEAAKAKVEMLVDRFTRAIKERDIRVAYIRLPRQFKGDKEKGLSPLKQNLDFVERISSELQRAPLGGVLRPAMDLNGAQAFGDYPFDYLQNSFGIGLRTSKIIRYLLALSAGLGAVGGTLLLLNLFFDLTPGAQRKWLLAGLGIVAVLCVSGGIGSKLVALQAGIVFPAIGILWGGLPRLWDKARRETQPHSVGEAISGGAKALLSSTAITMIGPMIIIALLNKWTYFSGTDKYLLPKATQLLPLLLVGLAFAGEVFPHRVRETGADAARRRARDRFNSVLDSPFTLRVAGTLMLVGVLGMLWIARTGNDSGMEISPIELKMRATLEQLFVTRPRTKEIMVGFPAFLFAVYFMQRKRWLLAVGAAILGTIGVADVLNTFCHIHTPIFYSALRTIHGLWLGIAFGAIALLIWAAVERGFAKRFLKSTVDLDRTPV
jgi:hypothetical protein